MHSDVSSGNLAAEQAAEISLTVTPVKYSLTFRIFVRKLRAPYFVISNAKCGQIHMD